MADPFDLIEASVRCLGTGDHRGAEEILAGVVPGTGKANGALPALAGYVRARILLAEGKLAPAFDVLEQCRMRWRAHSGPGTLEEAIIRATISWACWGWGDAWALGELESAHSLLEALVDVGSGWASSRMVRVAAAADTGQPVELWMELPPLRRPSPMLPAGSSWRCSLETMRTFMDEHFDPIRECQEMLGEPSRALVTDPRVRLDHRSPQSFRATLRYSLALVVEMTRARADAGPMFQACLDDARVAMGPGCLLVGLVLARVGRGRLESGQRAGASDALREAYRILGRLVPDHHPQLRRLEAWLGVWAEGEGLLDEARAWYDSLSSAVVRDYGPGTAGAATSLVATARIALRRGDRIEARRLLEGALGIYAQLQGVSMGDRAWIAGLDRMVREGTASDGSPGYTFPHITHAADSMDSISEWECRQATEALQVLRAIDPGAGGEGPAPPDEVC